ACHLRGAVTQASGHVVEQQQQGARRLTVATMAFSFGRSTVLCCAMSSIGVSAIVAWRHLVTVVRFRPQRRARVPVMSFDAWNSARTRGVVQALP
ncbi:MAG: hypothetical protein ACRYGC_08445, partial [Janthinobacterium lividum]